MNDDNAEFPTSYYDCVTNQTETQHMRYFRQKQPILRSLKPRAITGFLNFVTQSY